jgi:hypothetical protein
MPRIFRRTFRRRLSQFSLGFLFLLAASGSQVFAQDIAPPTQPPTQPSAKPPAKKHSSRTPKLPPDTFILVGAGDIAGCPDSSGAEATAKLIEKIPGTVFATGDLAYESGSLKEFQTCYQRTWGRFKDRTRPSPGNHEYNGTEATGYFEYWGTRAGEPRKGYYSYDLGRWHIIALNTNCNDKALGGCDEGSPQETWLRADLAAHPNSCTLAYGHHALFSSGVFSHHAIRPQLRPLWRDLYAAHADLVIAAHEHSYERFSPQDPDGKADPENGITEIVAGTGGRSHTLLGYATPNSVVRNDNTYGVLKLTLSPEGYRFEFIPEARGTFRDSGSGTCHAAPTATQ